MKIAGLRGRGIALLALVAGLSVSAAERRFEAVALVDSLDFGTFYDIEKDEGNLQTLEHVLLTHATDVWWRDKGGGRLRYPSKEEAWPISEYPFDKHFLPNEDVWGHLRLDTPGANAFPLVRRECARRGIGFGVHTTLEENHNLISLSSGWTLDHPQYWSRTCGGKPWLGCCALGYPEVIEHKLRMADERLELGPEVVFLDFYRSGSYHVGREYVKPVVDAWRRKYGCEPPHDAKDPRWLELVSANMSSYLRRFAARCHARGCRFAIGLPAMDDKGSRAIYEEFGVDWQALAADGTLDAVVVMSVKYDAKDVWNSMERIYRAIMASRGKADVYFPLASYNWYDRGYPGIAKNAKVSEAVAAERLLALARDVGARGVVMECVDHGNYSPEVCAVIGKALKGAGEK